MKSAITLFVALMSPCVALGNIATSDDCNTLQDFARFTMDMRQAGVPHHEALAVRQRAVSDSGESSPFIVSMTASIIQHAYRQPVEASEGLAKRAAIEFGESILAMCTDSLAAR